MKRGGSDEEILVDVETAAGGRCGDSGADTASSSSSTSGCTVARLRVPGGEAASEAGSRRGSSSSRLSGSQGDLPYRSGNTGRSAQLEQSRELFSPGETLPEEVTSQVTHMLVCFNSVGGSVS